MKQTPLFYSCFFGPLSTGVDGQQNLAAPVRTLLSDTFTMIDLSPATAETARFPTLRQVIAAIHRLLLVRLFRRPSGQVTVVDMMHSFASLPSARAADRFVLLGHDSYALRTRRDLAYAQGVGPRIRLALSALGWWYVELLLRRLTWKSLFASPLDRDQAAPGKGDVFAIPVSKALRIRGAQLRPPLYDRDSQPHILVSLPVVNPTQGMIDLKLVRELLARTSDTHRVTLWGKGAVELAARYVLPPDVAVVTWVADYADFVEEADLLVYPRLIGSGFHTKLAEALVLGVPCLCADWVAAPLIAAGYNGLRSFTSAQDFGTALTEALADLAASAPGPIITIPASAAPAVALSPIVAACTKALTTL